MFNLLGFTSSDVANSNTILGSLVDNTVTQRGSGYVVPSLNRLAGVYAMGTSISRAQVQSPKLRDNWFPDIEPVDVATLPSNLPPYHNFALNPMQMDIGEEVDVYRVVSVGTAERDYAGLWISDGPIAPVSSISQPIRATGATTVTANTWSIVPLTFPNPLPSRNYSVIGGRCHSATCVLWRLQFAGYQWRPGGIGFSTVAKWDNGQFRYGNMGVWGQFNVASPPQLEVLCTAADASEIVELDLVPMS